MAKEKDPVTGLYPKTVTITADEELRYLAEFFDVVPGRLVDALLQYVVRDGPEKLIRVREINHAINVYPTTATTGIIYVYCCWIRDICYQKDKLTMKELDLAGVPPKSLPAVLVRLLDRGDARVMKSGILMILGCKVQIDKYTLTKINGVRKPGTVLKKVSVDPVRKKRCKIAAEYRRENKKRLEAWE